MAAQAQLTQMRRALPGGRTMPPGAVPGAAHPHPEPGPGQYL
jgi:hypothetical protein